MCPKSLLTRSAGRRLSACLLSTVSLSLWVTAAPASAYLSSWNISPFPASKVIVGARWTTPRYSPPANQWGDVLPTVWADDDDQYTMIDDGGVDVPLRGGIWRQSLARIVGRPPHIRFSHVGDPNSPPPHTFSQVRKNPKIWQGPLGPYYSSGLLAADHLLFATQQLDWDWTGNGSFTGLQWIAYSADHGAHWVASGKRFPRATRQSQLGHPAVGAASSPTATRT